MAMSRRPHLGRDGQASAVGHRIPRVQREVEQRLPELRPVAGDDRVGAGLERELDRPAEQRLEQPARLGHDLVQIEAGQRERLAAAEGEQLARERRAGLGRLPDLLRVAAERAVVRQVRGEQLAVAADRGQRVVEVVRDTARQLSDRLQLLGVVQLVSQAVTLLLGPLALADVEQVALDARLAVLEHEVRLVLDPDGTAVLVDVPVLGEQRLAGDAQPRGVRQHAVAIVGMDDRSEQVRIRLPVVDRVPEHLLDLRTDVHVRPAQVERPDVRGERKLLDQGAVAKLERLLGPAAVGHDPAQGVFGVALHAQVAHQPQHRDRVVAAREGDRGDRDRDAVAVAVDQDGLVGSMVQAVP